MTDFSYHVLIGVIGGFVGIFLLAIYNGIDITSAFNQEMYQVVGGISGIVTTIAMQIEHENNV